MALQHRQHAFIRHEGNARILAFSLGALEQAHGDQPDTDDFGRQRAADLFTMVAIDVALLVEPLAEPLQSERATTWVSRAAQVGMGQRKPVSTGSCSNR